MTDMENEASLELKLRQIALEIFNTSSGNNASIRPGITILQEMNKAFLAAYIEKHNNPPPVIEIQRMRQLVLDILDDIDGLDKTHDIPPQ